MLSKKFLDSQRTVADLQQKIRDLQKQQIPLVSTAMCTCALGRPFTFDLTLLLL